MPSKTEFILEAKTKGISQASSATERLGQKGKAAVAAAREESSRLEQQLRKLVQRQTQLNKELDKTERGSDAYKKLIDDLGKVEERSGQVEKNLQSIQKAFKESAKEGAFFQGLLQGAVPGANFIQRGPGAMRQAAGVYTGQMARGVAGGVGQIPFQGAAGIAQALQSVPGGGFLAQPLMQAMQRAQQALQFRQQRQQMLPFLQMGTGIGGTITTGESLAQRRRRITAQIDKELKAQGGIIKTTPAPVSGVLTGERPFPTVAAREAAARAGRLEKKAAPYGGLPGYAQEQQRKRREELIEERLRAEEKERGPAGKRTRARSLQDLIRAQGQRFGYALPEAMQAVGAVSQVGGGRGEAIAQQNMVPMIMAAQRMGMGPDVAGAFLQGGRRGGLVGGRGRAGEAMEEAIKDGMALGLEGSELNDWLQQMAGDIRSWKTTGMPINARSITGIGVALAASGIGGLRGSVMAKNLASKARELSTRGPQTAAELILYQELGGWTGQGGIAEVEQAQLRMQKQKFTPEDLSRVFSRFLSAGGGGDTAESAARSRQTFRQAMQSLGVSVGIEESMLIEKQARGRGLSAKEQEALMAAQEERGMGVARAEAFTPEAVAQTVDAAIKRQAGIVNQQIASGQTMIQTMQNLESTTSNVVKGFTNLASGPLTNLTNSISGLSDEIPELTKRLRDLVTLNVGVLTASGD